jgi:hypothetical protein
MMRACTRCGRAFTPHDLARDESRELEAERRAAGLRGVLFRYYDCPACGQADIFVDVAPLPEETPEDFHRRRHDLETTVRELHADQVEVVVDERQAPGGR